MQRRGWRELSIRQRIGTVLLGAVQLALFGAAQVDISRRRESQVRGPKAAWRAIALVNFFGPVAYFAFGRRP